MLAKNRLNLLNDAEVKELYDKPQFNNDERKYFFSLSDNDHKILVKYKNLKSKTYFILQLGYFRATKQFYQFTIEDANKDTIYIIKTYLDPPNKPLTGTLWKEINKQQKLDILALYGYKDWSTKYIEQVENHLKELLRYYPKGNDTLRELFVYFENNKIVIPSYRTIQDLFTTVFNIEAKRLNKIANNIPGYVQTKLEDLIKNDDGISQLNVIKVDQKNFQYNSLKSEIKKAQQIKELYEFSKKFVPSLKISKNAARYYADVAEKYTASRIRKLDKPQQWLHLMCFVEYRYQQFMDNLITSFLYHVRSIMDEAKEYVNTQAAIHSASLVMGIPKVVQFLKWFSSDKIDPNTPYKDFSVEGFQILSKEQFPLMADFIEGKSFNKDAAKWKFYEKSSRIFALYLRPILLSVDFEFQKSNSSTMKFINILRNHYIKGKSPANLIITDDMELPFQKSMIKLLKSNPNDKTINTARFEFYVYKKMYHQIDRGRLFCNNSVSYCSLKHDLVSDKIVDNIDDIAKKFGYKKIPIYCDKRLDLAAKELSEAWLRTNKNIESGKNKSINIQKKENEIFWSLSYDTEASNDSSPFFKDLSQIEIADVMKFIGDKLNFWSAFTHIKHRYVKQKKPNPLAILACILSDAFGFGIKKMSEMSNIEYNHLRSNNENFIRTETLYKANDKVSNFIHSLPIHKVWNLQSDTIIADADGQKFETTKHTIQSRYSAKYFGRYKGVSVYSLVANNVSVNSKIIGPNEHESHYLYDMIYGNHSDVTIDKVTGDNHSVNQINFIALDAIDVAFIPSIKNIKAESEKLYSINDPGKYTGLIKPIGKVNIKLIKSQKREILRVLLSLIMQENTQSIIIRKLSSHKRYSRLRVALWEYNKIFKSTHVLNLINDEKLRKVIKTARNRTEAYHQLQGIIHKIYGGIFKGRKIVDNEISNQASRLVANCIIAYNSMLLNNVYENLISKHGKEKAKKILSKISPVAWRHILFTGRYNFLNKTDKINIETIANLLKQKIAQPSIGECL